jgi:hypothetical protein
VFSASGPTTADRNFLHHQLHATYAADSSSVWNFTATGGSIFAGNANGTFDDGSKGIYFVGYPDMLTPTGTGAAVYNGAAGSGKVVYLGFPFETITDAHVRKACLADALNFFGVPPLRLEAINLLSSNRVKLTMSGATGICTLQTGAVLNARDRSPISRTRRACLNSLTPRRILPQSFIG